MIPPRVRQQTRSSSCDKRRPTRPNHIHFCSHRHPPFVFSPLSFLLSIIPLQLFSRATLDKKPPLVGSRAPSSLPGSSLSPVPYTPSIQSPSPALAPRGRPYCTNLSSWHSSAHVFIIRQPSYSFEERIAPSNFNKFLFCLARAPLS
jgi:hypothetical protein